MKSRQKNRNCDGIALVIVLGIISIMMIMAVSFITLMRTERVSAKNFADVVKGREMARGMLDQVLIDLTDMGWSVATNLAVVSWTNNVFDLAAEVSDLDFMDEDNGGVYFIYDEPTLPTAISGQWSKITFTNQETDAGCLYNFLAVNDSGRLDIHHINTNLDLTRLGYSDPDIATIKKVVKDRIRMYSHAEIDSRFGPGSTNAFSNIMKNFTTYSRYTQKYIDPTTPANPVYVTNRVQIGGSVSGLQSNKAEIVSALTNSGVDIADTDFVFNNILDYVDDDSSNRNGGANGYCSEMLPMISEVAFAVSVTYDGTDTYTVNLSFTNEIWNPFEGTIPSGKYSVDWRGFTAVPNSLGFALTNTVGTNLPSLHTNEMTSSYVQYVGTYTVPPMTALPEDLGDVTFTIQPVIQDDNGDVDVIPPRSFKRLLTTPTLSSREAYEIDDPRLNHLPGKWTLVSTPTIEHMSTNFTGAGEIPLFVANTNIQNVGELGFVSVDSNTAWKSSINLVDTAQEHKYLLDYCTVHTNIYEYGLVNINARDAKMLETALLNPNIAFEQTNSVGNIQAMADLLAGRTAPCVRRSDAITEITDERVWAACSDLLDVYGTSFTVLLTTKIFKDNTSATDDTPNGTYDGPVTDPDQSSHFLVAQFWRDPISGETILNFLKFQRRND